MRAHLVVLLALLLAVGVAPASAQVGIAPGSLAPPVVVFPASAVNGAGVATIPILFPDGAALLPSVSFASVPTIGMWRNAGAVALSGSAVNFYPFGNGSLGNSIDTAGRFTWAIGLAFASLGTPANGAIVWCTDCAPTTPASCPGTKASCVCTGSGVGSLAVRTNALWYCPF